jgi:hypothetical protein
MCLVWLFVNILLKHSEVLGANQFDFETTSASDYSIVIE